MADGDVFEGDQFVEELSRWFRCETPLAAIYAFRIGTNPDNESVDFQARFSIGAYGDGTESGQKDAIAEVRLQSLGHIAATCLAEMGTILGPEAALEHVEKEMLKINREASWQRSEAINHEDLDLGDEHHDWGTS